MLSPVLRIKPPRFATTHSRCCVAEVVKAGKRKGCTWVLSWVASLHLLRQTPQDCTPQLISLPACFDMYLEAGPISHENLNVKSPGNVHSRHIPKVDYHF